MQQAQTQIKVNLSGWKAAKIMFCSLVVFLCVKHGDYLSNEHFFSCSVPRFSVLKVFQPEYNKLLINHERKYRNAPIRIGGNNMLTSAKCGKVRNGSVKAGKYATSTGKTSVTQVWLAKRAKEARNEPFEQD